MERKKSHLISFLLYWFLFSQISSLIISSMIINTHLSKTLNSNFWVLVSQMLTDLITGIFIYWLINKWFKKPSLTLSNPFKNNWPSACYLVSIIILAILTPFTKNTLMAMIAALSIAVCEELTFRMGVIEALKRLIPQKPIQWIIISGLIFGLIHGINLLTTHETIMAGLVQITDNICAGIILGCMYIANHQSLLYPISIHFLIDYIGLNQSNLSVTNTVNSLISLIPPLLVASLSLMIFIMKGKENETSKEK